MADLLCRCDTEIHARGLCSPCYRRQRRLIKRYQLIQDGKICRAERLYRITGVLLGAAQYLDYAHMLVPVIVHVYASDGLAAVVEAAKYISLNQEFADCAWVDDPLIQIVPEGGVC